MKITWGRPPLRLGSAMRLGGPTAKKSVMLRSSAQSISSSPNSILSRKWRSKVIGARVEMIRLYLGLFLTNVRTDLSLVSTRSKSVCSVGSGRLYCNFRYMVCHHRKVEQHRIARLKSQFGISSIQTKSSTMIASSRTVMLKSAEGEPGDFSHVDMIVLSRSSMPGAAIGNNQAIAVAIFDFDWTSHSFYVCSRWVLKPGPCTISAVKVHMFGFDSAGKRQERIDSRRSRLLT